MNKEPSLLAQLADGRWHSGEDLAASLGISRTAVWKQLNRLKDRGITLDRVRGRGYRLVAAPDMLDCHDILHQISQRWRQRIELDVRDSVDSTNRVLLTGKSENADDIRVCVADRQTQGRGRRGRDWISPPGANIYLSTAVTLTGGFAAMEGLSLVVGLATAKALESMGLDAPMLKWPNDVLVGGQKLAGVLIELQGELEGAIRVVIGIGINVHTGPEERRIDQPWVSLDQSAPGRTWKRNEVIASVINHVLGSLEKFESSGFGAFQSDWLTRDVLHGHSLRTEPHGRLGRGGGVDQSGAYRLETVSGEILLRSGELSIRRQNESAD